MQHRAKRSFRLLLLLVPALLVVLVLSHAFTGLSPPALAAGGNAIRVLLAAAPSILRVDGSGLGTEPAPDFALHGPLEVRVQSAGLLVLQDGGRPWVLDAPRLVLSWTGRATLRAETGDGRTSTSSQIGRLLVERRGPGLRLILRTDFEVYLTGVVEAEMGPRFPQAALKAQAVAARSFAWTARERRRDLAWDVRAGAVDQAFHGASEAPAVVRAVRDTAGEYLLWEGKPLRAYYGSTCGGRTRDGRERFHDVPAAPLRSVPCTACAGSPLYRWRRTLPRDRFGDLGVAAGTGPVEVEPTRRSERGDWIAFRIRRRGGRWRQLPIERLRSVVNLPSPWITGARPVAAGVLLEGRGFGHGVGLCQHGAAGWARAGKGYREILAHYYPGTEVGPLAAPAPEDR